MASDRALANRYVLQLYDYAAAWMAYLTGITPTLTSTGRSLAEQRALLNSNNPYPVNQPGDSSHNVIRSALGDGSLGVDSWVPDQTVTIQGYRFNSWEVWTYLREWVGLRVPSNDRVHSEIPDWRSYQPVFPLK